MKGSGQEEGIGDGERPTPSAKTKILDKMREQYDARSSSDDITDGFWYFILHKPVDVLCSTTDDCAHLNRRTIYDVIREHGYPPCSAVGRLDYATSGLLLMTDDNRLSACIRSSALSAKNGGVPVAKRYLLTVRGRFSIQDEPIKRLEEPIYLDGEREGRGLWTKEAELCPLDLSEIQLHCGEKAETAWEHKHSESKQHPMMVSYQMDPPPGKKIEHTPAQGWVTVLSLIICEGKNRQIRRLCTRSKLRLLRLHRVSVGVVKLGDLTEGSCRLLRQEELDTLYRDVAPDEKVPRRRTFNKRDRCDESALGKITCTKGSKKVQDEAAAQKNRKRDREELAGLEIALPPPKLLSRGDE